MTSRAIIAYSATPVAPQIWKCSLAIFSLKPSVPFRPGSSSCKLINVLSFLASSIASLTTLLLSRGIPSSEKPTAPASKSALKSVKSWPLKFLVIVATVLTLIFSFAAD